MLPPGEDTYEKVVALFPPASDQARAFAPVAPVQRGRTAAVRAKHVRDHLMAARGVAHHGPSGELNTHLAATMRSPHAQETLVRWANAWAGQALPAVVRQPWLRMVGIGSDKGGGKARPIVF